METSSTEHVLERPSRLTLTLLSINDVARVFDQVEPLLARACEHSNGEFTPQIVLAGLGLHDGIERLKLLALVDGDEIIALMVVTVTRAPTGKLALECLLTAGEDVSAWMPFEPMMDEWARAQGISTIRIPRARKGWQKVLKHWKLGGHVLEREI